MKKILVLFSIFYLASFSVFGQENALCFEIQQAKKQMFILKMLLLKK